MDKTAEIPQGATCLSQLKRLADEKPEKQAFVMIDKEFDKTIFTRKDVWNNSRKYAAILRRHGVRKGDIVCNTLVNSPERLVSMLGTVIAGAISMHGQIFLADGEDIIHSLKLAKCKTIIVDPGDVRGALPILTRLEYVDGTTGKTRYCGLPHLTTVIHCRVCCYDNEDTSRQRGLKSLEGETDMFEEKDIDENDMAFIFATSGSVGFSKLVPHSHWSCLRIARQYAVYMGIELDQSRYLSDYSLGYIGGFPGPYLVTGSTRVFNDLSLGSPDKFDEHDLRLINEEEIDCSILPVITIELLKQFISREGGLKKRLRAVLTGGIPMSEAILKDVHFITDSVNIVYGATELGFLTAIHIDHDTWFVDFCAGFLIDGCEVKIVDEGLKEVPPSQVGQVAVKNSTMTPGYVNDQESYDKDMMEDGFLLLGDGGYKNDKGQLFVLGRQAHAIHTEGGFVYYPSCLEAQILKCPGVQNAVVIGIQHPVLHEEICVCVIPTSDKILTIEQLQQYYKNRCVMDAKAAPNYYLFFESFPCNANGKLDRKRLLEECGKRLDITVERTS